MASEWEYRFPGYEQWVWTALEALSGTEQGHDFALQALGLIYFKFVCDRFAQRYYELLAEGRGWEEEPSAYVEAGFCYVPRDARWFLIVCAADGDKAAAFEDAMRITEQVNPSLVGLFPQGLSALNGEALALAVERLHYICMAEPAQRCELDRRCFAYALSRIEESGWLPGGQRGTPAGLARLVVAAMQIRGGRLFDPCCGTGDLLVQAAQFVEENGGQRVWLGGCEQDSLLRKLARMHLTMQGLEGTLRPENSENLSQESSRDIKANFVLTDRLARQKMKTGRKSKRTREMAPNLSNDCALIQQMLEDLVPGGRMGILLADSEQMAIGMGTALFRRRLVEEDRVVVVIRLPSWLSGDGLDTPALWILSKKKALKGMTLFVDAQGLGSMESRAIQVMRKEDVEEIGELCRSFYSGRNVLKNGFCSVVSRTEIAKQNFDLSPGCYVAFDAMGTQEAEGDGADSMGELTGELSELLHQSRAREMNMRRMLEAIGYEI